jgi:inner membrane protein
MDPVTHIVTGVALSQFVPAPSRVWAAAAGFFFAILPDLDYVTTVNGRLSYLKHHRGFTHSVFALFLFIFLIAGLGRLVGGPRWFKPLLSIGFLVLASHLFLDWTTSYGTQLFHPLSRVKFSLDWVFIIDPYLTALVAAAALALLISTGWGRTVGAACLGLGIAYILLCGFYHHQALILARQVFPHPSGDKTKCAALPQPFSPRHWLLVAADSGEVRQAFVELPCLPGGGKIPKPMEIPVRLDLRTPPRVPAATYNSPEMLTVYRWQAVPGPHVTLTPETRRILDTYLAFSRFPILVANDHVPGGIILTWVDLRFSVPDRAIPFVLQVDLDDNGRLAAWQIGGPRLPINKPSHRNPRSG